MKKGGRFRDRPQVTPAISAPPGTRTPNLPIKSRMLYQLS